MGEKVFMPVLNDFEISDEDKLRTVYEHIAQQIAGIIGRGKGEGIDKGQGKIKAEAETKAEKEKMLVTGGGAFNAFLIELISGKTPVELVIPANEIINFKEALIFAFLGVLKIRGEINCLASVTGAKKNHSTGLVFHP
jgi:anhydro-N-acetylmuramic acid kinase